jgi:hypothetical protein
LIGANNTGALVQVIASDAAPTSCPPDVVRVALACVLLSALEQNDVATCEIHRTEGILVRVFGVAGGAPSVDPSVTSVLARNEVAVHASDSSIDIRFPALDAESR